jgi:hypothetical protein
MDDYLGKIWFSSLDRTISSLLSIYYSSLIDSFSVTLRTCERVCMRVYKQSLLPCSCVVVFNINQAEKEKRNQLGLFLFVFDDTYLEI